MKFLMAQISMAFGVENQIQTIQQVINKGVEMGQRIFVFPELALPGFSREVVNTSTKENHSAWSQVLSELAHQYQVYVLAGMPRVDASSVFNSFYCFKPDGEIACWWDKIGLTESEQRFFHHGDSRPVIEIEGVTLSVVLCREVLDTREVTESLSGKGVELILWPSYIGWNLGEAEQLRSDAAYYHEAKELARTLGAAVVQCNWANGTNVPEETGLGGSIVISKEGDEIYHAPYDQPAVFEVTLSKTEELMVTPFSF
ncbi:carbon-nitrogen hydrolase family protein [Vibrio penaeicida]|uniref:carbon-nitrogen hydrolase family protein n=1 Tax=Vibrio penaeicida TaxID=104609 RepID=UPI000CEA0983|nr:carbon-nitrogen hydrolase family protein [Vibrio penaeicida]